MKNDDKGICKAKWSISNRKPETQVDNYICHIELIEHKGKHHIVFLNHPESLLFVK